MTLTISNTGLSPSNRYAGFPNLAAPQDPGPELIDHVTKTCSDELVAAGITPHKFPFVGRSEVPSMVRGSFGQWGFTRAWYYWVAEGPGIPPDIAEQLHATHGKQVRVAGHCGCPSPREWFKGFGVGSYHVDSPEGLKALVDTLRSICDPNQG